MELEIESIFWFLHTVEKAETPIVAPAIKGHPVPKSVAEAYAWSEIQVFVWAFVQNVLPNESYAAAEKLHDTKKSSTFQNSQIHKFTRAIFLLICGNLKESKKLR